MAEPESKKRLEHEKKGQRMEAEWPQPEPEEKKKGREQQPEHHSLERPKLGRCYFD